MKITIYDASGKILRLCDAPESLLQMQCSDGESYIYGWFDENSHYVEDGQALEMPEKTSEFSYFDYKNKSWTLNPELADQEIKQKRASLLASSDWTQLPDAPAEKKSDWAEYRQNLRDLTTQEGYPFAIIWPTEPR